MPMSAAIVGGAGLLGSVGGSLLTSSAATKASQAQVGLGEQALQLQQSLGQQGLSTLMSMFQQAQGAIQPVIGAGQGVLSQGQGIAGPAAATLQSLLTPGPNQTATLSQIPGFQFAQDWGQKAVQNIGSTTGLGGNTLTAGANYATGLAQQGYTNIVQALQGLLGSGTSLESTGAGTMASGANALAGAATGTGASAAGLFGGLANTVGGTLGSIGSSTASGILGSANALAGGLTGSASSISNAMILSKLLGGGVGGGNTSGIYTTGQNFGVPAMSPYANYPAV